MTFLSCALKAVLAGVVIAVASPASAKKLLEPEVKALTKRLQSAGLSRYMSAPSADKRVGCKPIEDPQAKPDGWKNEAVTRCTYLGKVAKGNKSPVLVVVLSDPPAERIARWMLTACNDIGAATNPVRARCLSRLYAHMKSQSSFHFPVAGLVDETSVDSSGAVTEGVCTVVCYFTFRDGVAVQVPALFASNPCTGEKSPKVERAISCFEYPRQPDDRLGELNGESIVLRAAAQNAGTYGRIASTTREHLSAYYKSQKPPVDHHGDNFPAALRFHHQAALRSDRNVLISAWTQANSSLLKLQFPAEADWRLGN